MASKDVLDKIFEAKEEDVGTFFDVMSKELDTGDGSPKWIGKEAKVKSDASYVEQVQGFIMVTHGVHGKHYVWHIVPSNQKRPWKVPMPRIFYAIGTILNRYLPNTVLIDIHPPQSDWEIKEITVRANDALDNWNITPEDLAIVTGQFFEVLNELV